MLAVAMLAQVVTTAVASAPLLLVAHLHLNEGLSLAASGALAAAPTVGTLVSLIAWGWIVDRVGERITLTAGLSTLVGASSIALIGAHHDSTAILAAGFALTGLAAASTNSASGRLVVGWFPAHRRGLAMGIRQTGLPLGVGAAALVVPTMTQAHGLPSAITVCVVSAMLTTGVVAALVVDPPASTTTRAADHANPYRADSRLVRIHLASALLVIPQYAVWAFMLVWLIDRHDWSPTSAGALYAASQILGAAGRIGVGWWSDRVGDRIGPIRTVAGSAALVMAALALTEGSTVAIAVMVAATVITSADNGLAFTAVAEIAGPRWSGRAFGLQNTGQYLTAALVPPGVGAMIEQAGYAWGFGVVAAVPLLAVLSLPRASAR